MNLWERLKNLKRLSEYEPKSLEEISISTKESRKPITVLIPKSQQKATFIPRIKRNPVEEIVTEQTQ